MFSQLLLIIQPCCTICDDFTNLEKITLLRLHFHIKQLVETHFAPLASFRSRSYDHMTDHIDAKFMTRKKLIQKASCQSYISENILHSMVDIDIWQNPKTKLCRCQRKILTNTYKINTFHQGQTLCRLANHRMITHSGQRGEWATDVDIVRYGDAQKPLLCSLVKFN